MNEYSLDDNTWAVLINNSEQAAPGVADDVRREVIKHLNDGGTVIRESDKAKILYDAENDKFVAVQ